MADASKPYGNVVYADPGYQADKVARYPVDTKAHAKSAWSYINMPKNAKLYTSAQLKRIKGRIMAALRKFGVSVSAKEAAGWSFDPAREMTETEIAGLFGVQEGAPVEAAIAECMGMNPQTAGSWAISASNGPVDLRLCSYGMDPSDLDVILRAAADAACTALAKLDPDMDGDIDVPGAPDADTDNDQAGESLTDDDLAVEQAALADLRAEIAALKQERDGLTGAGETTEPGTEPADESGRDQFVASLKERTPDDLTAGMETIETWAATGNYPAGLSREDLAWMWEQAGAELATRQPAAV